MLFLLNQSTETYKGLHILTSKVFFLFFKMYFVHDYYNIWEKCLSALD